jgi:hypothetical protein
MGPKMECELCGSKENLDYYAGGPVGCMCQRCKEIVLKYTKARQLQKDWWLRLQAERQPSASEVKS